MLKRIVSVVVLSIFLAHFAGFYIYFIVQLKQVRKEMRSKLKVLPVEELELIRLSSQQFKKAKVEEDEIRVNDKMYDIARVEKRGDLLLVYCIHDEAEDNILAFLDKILGSPLKDKSVPTGVLQFFSLNYLPVFWKFLSPEFVVNKTFTAYAETASQYYSTKVVPPPKV